MAYYFMRRKKRQAKQSSTKDSDRTGKEHSVSEMNISWPLPTPVARPEEPGTSEYSSPEPIVRLNPLPEVRRRTSLNEEWQEVTSPTTSFHEEREHLALVRDGKTEQEEDPGRSVVRDKTSEFAVRTERTPSGKTVLILESARLLQDEINGLD